MPGSWGVLVPVVRNPCSLLGSASKKDRNRKLDNHPSFIEIKAKGQGIVSLREFENGRELN